MAKVRHSTLHGATKSSPTTVIWCTLGRLLSSLSGGHWKEDMHTGTITVDFFGGGTIACYVLKRWLFKRFHRGLLTMDSATIWEQLPYIFGIFFSRAVRLLQEADLTTVSAGNKAYVGSIKKRRLSLQPVEYKGSDAPECIKCSILQRQPFDHVQRWQIAYAISSFATLTNINVSDAVQLFVTRMQERGDGKQRIKEFLNDVKHAKADTFPCYKRTNKSGLWCPFGGGDGVKTCLATRTTGKHLNIRSVTPSIVWAT